MTTAEKTAPSVVEVASKRARKEPRVYALDFRKPKKHGRQGDLYLWPVELKKLDKAVTIGKECEGENVQLVNGNTRGSRHCAQLPEGWKAFEAAGEWAARRQLCNVVLLAPEAGGTVEITHPEHAHHVVTCTPGTGILVTSQRDYAQDALARVRD